MAFCLHVVPSYGAPFAHIIEGEELLIGRSSSSGLVIEDEVVSRTHARLYKGGHTWFVEDMQSHNGTWLNGKMVDRPMVVGLGDVIRLSGTVITIQNAQMPGDPNSGDYMSSAELYKSVSEMINREKAPLATGEEDQESLARRGERFKLLNEIHLALARPISRADLLELILDRIFEHLRPDEGAIFLISENGDIEPVATRTLPGKEAELLCSNNLIEDVVKRGVAALIHDAPLDEKFAKAESMMAAGVRSLLAAPLLDSEGALGMIALHTKAAVRKFTENDMELLVPIASAAALRLRNMMLVEEAAQRLRDANRILEQKVNERTKELEAINREILQTRDQLIMQEKMASLGTLTAGIAHEIRNPLNFINNFAYITQELITEMKEELEEASPKLDAEFVKTMSETMEEAMENTGFITEHGNRANRIVQSMMELSYEDTGQYQETDINALVKEFVMLAYQGVKAKDSSLQVKFEENYDPDVGNRHVSPQNLGRVIICLVHNAIDAVLARTKMDQPSYKPRIRTHTAIKDNFLEISVEDNGIGIPEENVDKVLTPFFTTKPTGEGNIGLGLSRCYDIIVTEHRGNLDIETEYGEFTRITMQLPMDELSDKANTLPD